MEHDFMWTAGDCLSNMRLYVEGALVLFEDDALPRTKLAHEHEEWNAAEALNTIGEGGVFPFDGGALSSTKV